MSGPTLRLLSLGAGVQSTALAILAAQGETDRLDGAIFSDTGWEPRAVYAHLDRLNAEVLAPAGIPLHRVSAGNIRDDALDPDHRFASMPLHILNPDGEPGMARRQCTSEYKLKPIMRKTRELLGAQPKENGVPGRVPTGRVAETWIGISTDEQDRAERRKQEVGYSAPRFPLLELGLSRAHCEAINRRAGFEQVAKSACIGCPFHTNRQWREIRDKDPESWADAVDFDRRIRAGSARINAQGQHLLGAAWLHRSRVPLDQAPIDRVTHAEWRGLQPDLVAELEMVEWEESLPAEQAGDLIGCSPWGCRSGGLAEPIGEAS